MTTAIVTDSTTSLAPETLDRPDVRMVPLSFHFGAEETYTDKVDLSDEEFYEKLKASEEFPTTSQPPAGAFVEAYESLQDYDDILVLTISRELSGTYDSAVTAADMVDTSVQVLDTRSAEMGSGLILLEALRVVDEGGSFDDVRQAAERAIQSCQIFFAVGTLEYLAKSGRIGRAQRLVGTALNVRPVLKVENGVVVPHKRARGRKRQLAAIAEEAKPPVAQGKTVYFGHIAAQSELTELCEKLGIQEPRIATLGGVVGSHVGPGAYGLAHL
ncbi:DegV family protein [soil metagenome]